MKYKLLRVACVLFATIGGALLGFSLGMGYMHNAIMDGLGLLEGGTPTYLDMDTLLHVSRLMSDIIRPSTIQAMSGMSIHAIAGLAIVSITLLVALLVPTRSRPSKKI